MQFRLHEIQKGRHESDGFFFVISDVVRIRDTRDTRDTLDTRDIRDEVFKGGTPRSPDGRKKGGTPVP